MDNFDLRKYLSNNPLLKENKYIIHPLAKKALSILISKGNKYTPKEKVELEVYFDTILKQEDTEEEGIKSLNKFIEDIDKEILTSDDIIYDLVDGFGGDYDGSFIDRGWGNQDND